MLTIDQMMLRLAVAVILGALIGLEREWVGKDAGIRTDIMVASGSALFSMIGLMLPYIVAIEGQSVSNIIAGNGGYLSVIANVVVGSGFLGAGVIIKHGIHVRGLTTAATMWFVAAIGVLVGIGLVAFATYATLGIVLLLVVLRKASIGQPLAKLDEEK